MRKQDRDMVNWFKAELRSYYGSKSRVRHIESKIRQLEARFNVRSPDLSGLKGTPVSNDERLAEYITEKAKYEKELAIHEQRQQFVEEVLSKIPESTRNEIIAIYSSHQNINAFALRSGYSSVWYQELINRAIFNALTKV